MITPENITTKKFITFIAIAFGTAMIPLCLAGYMLSIGNTLAFMFLFRVVAVFIPLAAVFISGAGFKKLGFKPGRFIWIIPALVAPQILSWIGAAVFFAVFPESFELGFDGLLSQLPSELASLNVFSSIDPSAYLAVMIFMSLTFIPVSQILPSFGEEAGWRGVMYPFLKTRFGKTAGRIIGGVLWGMWHWPLILIGNYFYGSNYPGSPVLGPVMICIALTSFGILIDYLYEKSGSIIIPSLAHSAMNAASMPMLLLTSATADQILGPSPFALFPAIPVIIAAIALTVTDRNKKV